MNGGVIVGDRKTWRDDVRNNGPTLAVHLWCLVGPMSPGWDGQAPDGTMGFAGQEWPSVSGPGWGPPGRGRQGAGAKPLTPNFCARCRAHPRSFCSSWKPGPNRKVQMWSWTRSCDRAVWGGPAARHPVGQVSLRVALLVTARPGVGGRMASALSLWLQQRLKK